MEIVFLIIILFVLLGGLALIFWFLRNRLSGPKNDEQSLLMLQNQITEISRTLDSKLGESTQMIQRQLNESIKVIEKNAQELTKVSEGQKQVIDITKQLDNLQDILKNPKQRGVLGEYFLKTVLENVLPPGSFQMQYEFKDGVIVDAVILVKDKIIPVDSKFSLENYNRLLETKEAG
ncbi:MAG: DNA recombination protein RmuC, partial [Candidatus Paceibacterota bacterium]